jgi:cytochrome c oxidase assembly protein subunit 11
MSTASSNAGNNANRTKANQQLLVKLLVIAVLMLCFAYSLIPIYRKICEVLGVEQTRVVIAPKSTQIDYSRKLNMQFVSNSSSGLPWTFVPLTNEQSFHPGETVTVVYRVKNTLDRDIVAQAKPHIQPESVAKYVSKEECFCFRNQTFKAGETKDLPVVFRLDSAIPKDAGSLAMSYTFFDVASIGVSGADTAASVKSAQ